MAATNNVSLSTLPRDLMGGLVVFLVVIRLCLGIALAPHALQLPKALSGIVGGLPSGTREAVTDQRDKSCWSAGIAGTNPAEQRARQCV